MSADDTPAGDGADACVLSVFMEGGAMPQPGQMLDVRVRGVEGNRLLCVFVPRNPTALQVPRHAVVELMGHVRIAGLASQERIANATMLRVDVPEVEFDDYTGCPLGTAPAWRRIPAHSRTLNTGSIYAVNWCTEAEAIEAAREIGHRPVQHRGKPSDFPF